MNQRNLVEFGRVLEEIQDLVRNGRSGTLFVTTDDNHSARFVLDEGRITSIGFGPRHGYDALVGLSTVRRGAFRFVEGGYLSMEEVPLPETGDLLELLRAARAPTGGGSTGDDRRAPQDDRVAALRRELAMHVGPFATILCEEYLEDHGLPSDQARWSRMVETLAEEIDDERKRALFRAAAAKALALGK